MNIFRAPAGLLSLALLGTLALCMPAEPARAATPSAVAQTGKLAQVRSLMTARLPADQQSTEGMGFLFLVTPTTAANSGFAIKETRDFQLEGASYQDRTQSEMGRRFEPNTQVMGAEKFFVDNPALKPAEVAEVPKGAVVISITMRGARIPPVATAAITLSVGYDKQVEEFTFSVASVVPR